MSLQPIKCKTATCEFFANETSYCSVCFYSAESYSAESYSAETSVEKEPTKITKRCHMIGCKKRLNMMGVECKCGNTYCYDHRLSFSHHCVVDYNMLAKAKLANENTLIAFSKVEKI